MEAVFSGANVAHFLLAFCASARLFETLVVMATVMDTNPETAHCKVRGVIMICYRLFWDSP